MILKLIYLLYLNSLFSTVIIICDLSVIIICNLSVIIICEIINEKWQNIIIPNLKIFKAKSA